MQQPQPRTLSSPVPTGGNVADGVDSKNEAVTSARVGASRTAPIRVRTAALSPSPAAARGHAWRRGTWLRPPRKSGCAGRDSVKPRGSQAVGRKPAPRRAPAQHPRGPAGCPSRAPERVGGGGRNVSVTSLARRSLKGRQAVPGPPRPHRERQGPGFAEKRENRSWARLKGGRRTWERAKGETALHVHQVRRRPQANPAQVPTSSPRLLTTRRPRPPRRPVTHAGGVSSKGVGHPPPELAATKAGCPGGPAGVAWARSREAGQALREVHTEQIGGPCGGSTWAAAASARTGSTGSPGPRGAAALC